MLPYLSHFAINADDVDASLTFYQAVFGWTFDPWGPPGFFKVRPATDATPGHDVVIGALQQRRELVPGLPTVGLEGTFAVDDVDATADAVRAAGGVILMERATIPTVGHLIFFRDPSGHPVGAMQYDPTA